MRADDGLIDGFRAAKIIGVDNQASWRGGKIAHAAPALSAFSRRGSSGEYCGPGEGRRETRRPATETVAVPIIRVIGGKTSLRSGAV
jgi:hypothetical protein